LTGNEAVLVVVEALDACTIPYMIVGSFSSNRYGIERSTQDADFVVDLGEGTILALQEKLPPEIRIDPQMSLETVTMNRRYIAEVRGTHFKLEFFLLGLDPHHQERFRRRRPVLAGGRNIWFPSPEDVIIQKLRWAMNAYRSKDRDDARDVIAVQDVEGNLDWPYIHSWCERHGTRALLDEIRASIPPI
jgi:hypothetical protein